MLFFGTLLLLLGQQSLLPEWIFQISYGQSLEKNVYNQKHKILAVTKHLPVETELFIGVNLGETAELAKAISDTWGSVSKEIITVGFFACNTSNVSLPFIIKDTSYPCFEYPPMESWRISLKIMSRFERVKWFLKCDDDSYVNTRALIDFLRNVTRDGTSHEDRLYFGSPGYGRKKERHLLGLRNKSFAMGGPCVGLSAGAMKALRPILDECMRWPTPRPHSDTQLGICLQALNISLRLPHNNDNSLSKIFRHMYGDKNLHLDGSVTAPFAASTVPAVLGQTDLDPIPITLHSLKDPVLMHRIHAQLHYGATPIGANADPEKLRVLPCVHNPAVVRAATTCAAPGPLQSWTSPPGSDASSSPLDSLADKCSVSRPECPSPSTAASWTADPALRPEDVIVNAVIVCLRPAKCVHGPLFRNLTALGVPVDAVTAVVGAGPGSAAQSLHKALHRALSSAHGERRGAVLVAEESAVLSPGFARRLAGLLAQPRCGCPLDAAGEGCTPGVLLLAAKSSSVVETQYRTEAKKLAAGGIPASALQCVNALPETNGGIAALVAVSAIPLAQALLAADPEQSVERFFLELSLAGLPVRVAWPPLAAADPRAVAAGSTKYSSLTAAERR